MEPVPGSTHEALDRLADRYSLGTGQRDRLLRLLHVVTADPRAPTAIRDPAAAIDLHLADSLAGLEVDALASAARIADLGAGAGFPGLPLAIALPRSHVALVESNARKCGFLRALVAAIEAENVTIDATRAEQWAAGFGASDVVVARALALAPVVAEYAAPLLRRGGVLVDWRGRRDRAEERAALHAAAELGLRLEEVRQVRPFAGAHDRHLYVYSKVRETPSRFPRRPGIARKRPLGLAHGDSGRAPADRDGR